MQSYQYDPYGCQAGIDTRPAMLGAVLRAYNDAYIEAQGREAYGSAAPKRQRILYAYADEAERLADLRAVAQLRPYRWRLGVALSIATLLAFTTGLFLAITDWPLLEWLLAAILGANVALFIVLLAAYGIGRLNSKRQARRAARKAQQVREEAWA